MRIIIYTSARAHSINDDEIRETIEYPYIRYRTQSRIQPDAETYVYIGGPDGGPWIEVAGEQFRDEIHVFHAMLLTRRVAVEAYLFTGETISLLDDIVGQRDQRPREE
ncbi:hypothetical protein [Corynebacterium sputi]|uniref:hypothetical protein n=1 Tax=Corynebacterium sputi TaxID=489915 RepID=UPI00047CCA16|nr:hypothetical protein [Corynebacterium sputi]